MIEYALPGIWVRERTLDVPLDYADSSSGSIRVFVRELSDPDRRHDDLPLLCYLQGGPGGSNPRPLKADSWIAEALTHYRLILVDQRGTGGSAPVDAALIAEMGAQQGADYLTHFRADSIVADLEQVRKRIYGGTKWATLAQSYGGWLTLSYLSLSPEALAACYVCGGIPGTPPNADAVYARTFPRVAAKTAEYYRRYPDDVAKVAAIADHLAGEDVRLPDGDRLTVERFQSLGCDFGMKPGFERMHWLVEKAFIRDDRFSEAFLAEAMSRSACAGNPLYWPLQETIYGNGDNGPLNWAAQRARDSRPEFDPERRPMLFTGEMAFPWMFDQIRLLKGFRPAVTLLERRQRWSRIYDLDRLANSAVPVAAAVYFDDMYVDSGLQLDTLSRLGNAQAWITNEYEHDGIGSGMVLTRLREIVRDRGGEIA